MGFLLGIHGSLLKIMELSVPLPMLVLMFFLGLGGVLGIIGGWTYLLKEEELKRADSRMNKIVSMLLLAGGISAIGTMVLLGPPFEAMGRFANLPEYVFWLGFIGFGFYGMYIGIRLVSLKHHKNKF